MENKAQNNVIKKLLSVAKKVALAVVLVALLALTAIIAFVGGVSPELLESVVEPNLEIIPETIETEQIAYAGNTAVSPSFISNTGSYTISDSLSSSHISYYDSRGWSASVSNDGAGRFIIKSSDNSYKDHTMIYAVNILLPTNAINAGLTITGCSAECYNENGDDSSVAVGVTLSSSAYTASSSDNTASSSSHNNKEWKTFSQSGKSLTPTSSNKYVVVHFWVKQSAGLSRTHHFTWKNIKINYTISGPAYYIKINDGGADGGSLNNPSFSGSSGNEVTFNATQYSTVYNLYYFNNLTKTGYHYNGLKMTNGSGSPYWDFYSAGSGVANTSISNDSVFAQTNNNGNAGDSNFRQLTDRYADTVTLTVQWAPNTYTLRLDTNGGVGTVSRPSFTATTSNNIGEVTLTYDKVENIWNFKANLTRTGYKYAGLIMTGAASSAKWNYYHSDYGDHTGSSTAADKSIGNNTLFATENGDINVRYLTPTQGGVVTITVQWTPITYTLAVDKNGGSYKSGVSGLQYKPEGGSGGTTFTSSASLTYDTTYDVWYFDTNCVTRTGYKYAGLKMSNGNADTAKWGYWSTSLSSGGEFVTNMSLANDTLFAQSSGDINVRNLSTTDGDTVTFTIQWTPITYNVSVNMNGGTGSLQSCPKDGSAQTFTSSTTLTYDVAYNIWNFGSSVSRTGYLYNGVVMTDGDSTAKWGYWNKDYGNGGNYVAEVALSNNTAFAEKNGDLNFKNLKTTQGSTVTLTIQWKPITYNVVYNANKPSTATYSVTSVPGNATWTYDADQTLAAAPSLTGWKFDGWYKDADCTIASGAAGATLTTPNYSTTQDDTVNLYAKWTPITYTLRVQTNGATNGSMARPEINAATQTYGDATYTFDVVYNPCHFDAVYRPGYTYAGVIMTNGNNSTAKWDYWNTSYPGGSNTAATQSLSNNTLFAQLDGDLNFKNLATTQGTIVTMTIQWTPNNYSVTLNNQNATSAGSTSVTATYDNSMPSATMPTRTGYTFGGYYTGPDGTGLQYYTSTGASARRWDNPGFPIDYQNPSAAATYQQVEYVYTADSSGAYINTGFKPSSLTKIEIDTKIVAGRSPFGELATNAQFNLTASGDQTDYFHWGSYSTLARDGTAYGKRSIYVIDKGALYKNGVLKDTKTGTWTSTYDLALFGRFNASGAFEDGGGIYIYGCRIWENGVLVRNFIPCYRISDGVIGLYETVYNAFYTNVGSGSFEKGGNVTTPTLYAKWTPNTYTASYNYAGGTNGTSAPTSWTYDQAQAVSAPTRAGYTFKGWTVTIGLNANTAKYGSTSSPATAISSATTLCVNGATGDVYFKNVTPNDKGSVTFTANWQAKEYTITYQPQGGAVDPKTKAVTYQSTYGTLATPTRAGYTFAGWKLLPDEYQQVQYIEGAGGGYVLTDVTPKGTGSIRLVAQPTGTDTNQSFWVARGSGSTDRAWTLFGLGSGGRYRFDYQGANTDISTSWNATTQLTISVERGRLYVNNSDLFNYSAASYTAGGPLMFMASYYGGAGNNLDNRSKMKFYGAVYWEGDTTVASFVPCYRKSDNKAGLYDVIGKKFYPGSDTLTCGSNVGFIESSTTFDAGGNVTLYANWTVKSYTVTYNAQGGSVSTSSANVALGNNYPTLPTPTRTGYTFLGWRILPEGYQQVEYIQANADAHVLTDIVPLSSGSVRLVEMQTQIDSAYQTYFVARGASGLQDHSYNLFMIGGKLRYDYNGTEGTNSAFAPSANTKYVVTTEKNYSYIGSSLVQAHNAASYTVGGPLIFLSSYSGGTGTGISNRSRMRIYGVTIWDNGGDATHYLVPCKRSGDGKLGLYDVIGGSFYVGSGTLTAPEGTGYVSSSYEFSAGKNVTLYACWRANTYNIVYNANKPDIASSEVNGMPANDVWTYDSNGTLGSAPSLTGWNFVGWYRNEVGTSLAGAAGETLTKPNYASTQGATVYIYALWTQKTYVLSFGNGYLNANFPSVVDSNKTGTTTLTVTYDAIVPTLAGVPNKNGFTFLGYYLAGTSTQYISGSGVGQVYWRIDGQAELRGMWSINSMTSLIGKVDDNDVTTYSADYNTGVKVLSVSPTHAADVTFGYEWTYASGTASAGATANKLNALTKLTTDADGENYSYSVTVTASMTGPDNTYYSTSGTVSFTGTINQKAISHSTIVITKKSLTYTGFAQAGLNTIRDNNEDLVEGADKDYTIVYSNNINAGTNTASMTITGHGNYKGTRTETFSIARLTIAGDAFIASINGLTSGLSLQYAGVNLTPTPALTWQKTAETLVTLTQGASNSNKDYSVSYTNNRNVGTDTAIVTFSGINNFTGSITKTFTITRAPLTVRADDCQITYGDAKPVFTATITGILGTDTASDAYTGTPLVSCNSYMKGDGVGTYDIVPAERPNNSFYSTNYEFVFVNGTMTVVKKALIVTLPAEECIYGNDAPAITVFDLTGEGLITTDYGEETLEHALENKASVTYGGYAKGSNVGYYTMGLSFSSDPTNYTVSVVTSTLTVIPRIVSVTANSFTGDDAIDFYDPAPVYTVTYANYYLPDFDTANNCFYTSKVAGAPLISCDYAVGSAPGSYTIDVDVSGLSSDNYSFIKFTGILAVNSRGITLTVTTPLVNGVQTLTYDGRTHALAVEIADGGLVGEDATKTKEVVLVYKRVTVADNELIETSIVGEPRNYGVYRAYASAIKLNGEFADQYAVPTDLLGTISIEQREVFVNVTFDYPGGVWGKQESSVSGVYLDTYTITYTGQPIAATVTYELGYGDELVSDAGFIVCYDYDNNHTAPSEYKDGYYKVYLSNIQNDQLQFRSGSWENYSTFTPGSTSTSNQRLLFIEKKTVTVTADNLTISYGDWDDYQNQGYFIDGLVAADAELEQAFLNLHLAYVYDGDDVNYSQPTAVGDHTIVPIIDWTSGIFANYDVQYEPGALHIVKRQLYVTVKAGAENVKTYTASTQDAEVAWSGLLPGDAPLVTKSYVEQVSGATDPRNVGVYNVTLSVARVYDGETLLEYYDYDNVTYTGGTLTIERAPITLLRSTDSVVFDGETHTYLQGDGISGLTWSYLSGIQDSDVDLTLVSATLAYSGTVKDAGTYHVTVSDFTFSDDGLKGNYFVLGWDIVVTPRNVVLSVANKTVTYNAIDYILDKTTEVTYSLGTGDAISFDLTYNGAFLPAHNAGTYAVAVDLSSVTFTVGSRSNYGTISCAVGTLTVNKRELYVTAGGQSATYDGIDKEPTVSYTGWAENGLQPTATSILTYYNSQNEEGVPNALGDYRIVIGEVTILPAEVADNYLIVRDEAGVFTVANRRLTFTKNTTNANAIATGAYTYFGQEITIPDNVVNVGGDGLLASDTVTYVWKFKPYEFADEEINWATGAIDAGTWNVRLTGLVFSDMNETSYAVTERDVEFTVQIAKRDIVVSVVDKSVEYSGENVVADVEGDTLVSGDVIECDFTYGNGNRNVGAHSVAITSIAFGTIRNNEQISVTNNYNVTQSNGGTITITKRTLVLTVHDVVENTDGYYYDNTPKRANVTTNIGVGDENGFTYSLAYQLSGGAATTHTDAGTWIVKYVGGSFAFAEGFSGNYEDDVYVQFTSSAAVKVSEYNDQFSTMVITPMPVEVTIQDDLTPVYDKGVYTLTETYGEGVVEGQIFTATIEYYLNGEGSPISSPIQAGTYVAHVVNISSSSGHSVGNYNFDITHTGTLVINKYQVELGIQYLSSPQPFTNSLYTRDVIVPQTPDGVKVSASLRYLNLDTNVANYVGAQDIANWRVTISGNYGWDVQNSTQEERAFWDRNYEIVATASLEFSIERIKIRLKNRTETKSVEYNGGAQAPIIDVEGLLSSTDKITVYYQLYQGTSSIGQNATSVGDYSIVVTGVAYSHTEGSEDHSIWYELGNVGNGYDTDHLIDYGETGAWVFAITRSRATVSVIYKGTDSDRYIYNAQPHEMDYEAVSTTVGTVSKSLYNCTLAYSRSSNVYSGVWVFKDSDKTWKIINLGTGMKGDAADVSYLPINAGTWYVTAFGISGRGTDSRNYEFYYEGGTVAEMAVQKFTVNLKFGENIELEYDGEQHEIGIETVQDMYSGDTVSASLEYRVSGNGAAPWMSTISGIGSYDVRVKEGTIVTTGDIGNYNFVPPQNNGFISITARKITFVIGDITEYYNGTGHTPEMVAVRLLDEDAQYVKVVVDTVAYGKNSTVTTENGDNVNVNDGECFAKVSLAHFEKVDSSVDQAVFEAVCVKYDINYNVYTDIIADITYNSGRVTVIPAKLRIVITNTTVKYNGEAHTTTATATPLYGTDSVEVTLAYGDNVNVGTCRVTPTSARIKMGNSKNYVFVEAETNYQGVAGSIIISPCAVTPEFVETNVVYNGNPRGQKITMILKDEDNNTFTLYGDDYDYLTWSVTYAKQGSNVTTRTPVDVGVWTATLDANSIGLTDRQRGNNYVFATGTVTGTLNIEKATYDFTSLTEYIESISGRFSAVYNGEGQVPDMQDKVPQGADKSSYVLRAVFDDTVRDVSEGEKELHVTFKTFVRISSTEERQVDSPNYVVPTQTYTVRFSITQLALNVVWGPVRMKDGVEVVAVEYNGGDARPVARAVGDGIDLPLNVNVSTSNFSGKVSNEAYHASASFTAGSEEEQNFSLIDNETAFYVVKKIVAVKFFDYIGLVYNGQEQGIQVQISDGGLVGDDRLPLLIHYDKAVVRDAGTYTATAYVDEDNVGDIIENYELDTGISCTFTIAKRKARITAKDLSSTYGSPIVSLRGSNRYVAENFIENDVLSVTLKKEEGSEVGEYGIIPQVDMLNYDVECIPGKYTIYPKEITVVIHDQIQTDPLSYDLSQVQGTAWDLKPGDTLVGDDRLNVSVVTFVDLSDPSVTTGDITATYSNKNYIVTFVGDSKDDGKTYESVAHFIVTKTRAVLSVKEDFLQKYPNNSKVYDGEAVRIRVENSGGESVSFFINGVASDNSVVEPGVYNIVVKGKAKAQFYPPEDLSYTFTIYPNQLKTDFGGYSATVKDENGYSTSASFSLVENKVAETSAVAAFSSGGTSDSKQISQFYLIESDGDLSGSIQLDLSSQYSNGDKVTLYIQKKSGEFTLETFEVKGGVVTIKNAGEIQGIGFVEDDNGPGFMMILIYLGIGVLVLGLLLIPVLARRR